MNIHTIVSFFFAVASLFLTGGSKSLQAQDGTKTPEGVTLPRSSYYNVTSNIPGNAKTYCIEIKDLELPCTSKDEEIIRHTAYSMLYDHDHKQARWVAYELTAEETRPVVKRTNRFIPDPVIHTGSASNKDYQNSGYDRGHLAPSADMCFSKETMLESFYLSNMSPQKPGFNRGIWKDLETLVRVWAEEDSSIYIVTGGILTPGLPAIGANKVSIPTLFYKVILDYREPVVKGIGIVIPNDKSDRPLSSYAISIDSVESLTGLNFFCRLPDDIEYKIEVSADTTQWIWHPGAARQQKGDED